MERKQAQIDHAKDKSDFASKPYSMHLPTLLDSLVISRERKFDSLIVIIVEHVKLADKLSNLNDLISIEGRPAGWSVERIQVSALFAP